MPLMAAMLLILSGCHDRSDEPGPVPGEPTTVTLRYLWPDTLVRRPEAMEVVFYPADSQGMKWRFTLPAEGSTVTVPAGRYALMSYSADMADLNVVIEGGAAAAVVEMNTGAGTVIAAADRMMWGANTHTLTFSAPPASNVLTMVATPVTARYRIRVIQLVDTTGAPLPFAPVSPVASLDGMARSLGMFTGTPEGASGVTIGFPMSAASRDAALDAQIITLGPQEPGPRERNLLTLSFRDPAGLRWTGRTDVGGQIADAPYPKALTIIVDTLAARPEGTPWSPVEGVDDWTTHIIDIYNNRCSATRSHLTTN